MRWGTSQMVTRLDNIVLQAIDRTQWLTLGAARWPAS